MKVGTKKEAQKYEIKVTSAHQFDDGSVTFDMTVNGVTIYGSRIVEGSKGTFVSFPSRKGKDNKYYAYAFVKLSADDVKDIISQIEKL